MDREISHGRHVQCQALINAPSSAVCDGGKLDGQHVRRREARQAADRQSRNQKINCRHCLDRWLGHVARRRTTFRCCERLLQRQKQSKMAVAAKMFREFS